MTDKEKAIAVILKIREREKKMVEKAKFCREHKFTLESFKYTAIQEELDSICFLLQDEFETGSVYLP